MALWKPFRGEHGSLDSVEKHDGYAYFCTDDGSLFFDYADENGELQRKQVAAGGSGVGEDAGNGREVFNDYENNIGYAKAFEIIYITDMGDGTFDINYNWNGPNGLEPGMRISMQLGKGTYYDCAAITYVRDGGGDIIVDHLPETDTTNANGHDSIHGNFFWIVGHPELGTTDILSQYIHAEGTETEAHFYAAHAEGYQTNALGKYSHAEGRNTTACLGGHAEGLNTMAKGHYSHAEGSMSETQGIYSHAEGSGTYATGEASHAEGNGATALGIGSHAEGLEAQAIGRYAHAEGINTQAQGYGDHAEGVDSIASSGEWEGSAHAEGHTTYASGVGAHAEGQRTQAVSPQAHAEGLATVAANTAAHSEGQETYANGMASHAEGLSTFVSSTSMAAHAGGGYSRATGNYAFAQGYKADASNISATAVGHITSASGLGAMAEGVGTGAVGEAAHAEGNTTRASGAAAHSEGQNTYASNRASHAEGRGTEATAEYSHAEGWNTKATGVASHSAGIGTRATGQSQTVVGQYNIEDTDAYFIVGNGTGYETAASNAFIVKKDGTLQCGNGLALTPATKAKELTLLTLDASNIVAPSDNDDFGANAGVRIVGATAAPGGQVFTDNLDIYYTLTGYGGDGWKVNMSGMGLQVQSNSMQFRVSDNINFYNWAYGVNLANLSYAYSDDYDARFAVNGLIEADILKIGNYVSLDKKGYFQVADGRVELASSIGSSALTITNNMIQLWKSENQSAVWQNNSFSFINNSFQMTIDDYSTRISTAGRQLCIQELNPITSELGSELQIGGGICVTKGKLLNIVDFYADGAYDASPYEYATKKYVDDAIGQVNAALDAILATQQALIGGNS